MWWGKKIALLLPGFLFYKEKKQTKRSRNFCLFAFCWVLRGFPRVGFYTASQILQANWTGFASQNWFIHGFLHSSKWKFIDCSNHNPFWALLPLSWVGLGWKSNVYLFSLQIQNVWYLESWWLWLCLVTYFWHLVHMFNHLKLLAILSPAEPPFATFCSADLAVPGWGVG